MAKVMLATGLIVAYGYVMEVFIAWYSGNPFEEFMMLRTAPTGPYWSGLLGADRLQHHHRRSSSGSSGSARTR